MSQIAYKATAEGLAEVGTAMKTQAVGMVDCMVDCKDDPAAMKRQLNRQVRQSVD